MSIFKKVAELFIRFPGLSQGAVASGLQVTGDVIAQKVFEKRENLNLRRSVNFAVLGFFSGYVQMKWYGYLYTRFQGKYLVRTLKKLVGEFSLSCNAKNALFDLLFSVDQLIFAPALILSQIVFLAWTGTANSDDTKKNDPEKLASEFSLLCT